MLLLTGIAWLFTAQVPQEPAPCHPNDTCYKTGFPAHVTGHLRGDAASGYRVELEEAVRLLDAPFTSSTQPLLLLEDASTAAGLVGQRVNAEGNLDQDQRGLVLRKARVRRQTLFNYIPRTSEPPLLERLCVEPQRKHFTAWATARAIPDAGALAETACAFLAVAKPAATGAPDRARRLAFPFSYLNCQEGDSWRKFKTAKQFEAQCGPACYPAVPMTDYYALDFTQGAQGRWQASMRATGNREEAVEFIREEKSGAWKLVSVSTFTDECD
jgi:hypothetical protein